LNKEDEGKTSRDLKKILTACISACTSSHASSGPGRAESSSTETSVTTEATAALLLGLLRLSAAVASNRLVLPSLGLEELLVCNRKGKGLIAVSA
jgi:hypothetical protein